VGMGRRNAAPCPCGSEHSGEKAATGSRMDQSRGQTSPCVPQLGLWLLTCPGTGDTAIPGPAMAGGARQQQVLLGQEL